MKIERTKNAGRNFLVGSVLKVYQIIVPFAVRTVMIYSMGVQYLGLNSLFTSILQVLNLAELGVGNAMVYSMYRPIAEDDTASICALLRLYRTYYRIIGLIIAGLGTALIPFLPQLIKEGTPAGISLTGLYLLNLASVVLSYWLFAYKGSLFRAHQRTDIPDKITLATTTIQYGVQLAVLLLWKNYYVYVLTALLAQATANLVVAAAATRKYPKYVPTGKLPQEAVHEINGRIRDLFTAKFGAVIYNSADTVVISGFLGLTVLAIYQNYFYIMNSIMGVVGVMFSASMAGIGNSILTESKEKNTGDLYLFTFLLMWITGVCTVCLLCLYQPFMQLWVGKELMLSNFTVILFCIYYFTREISQLLNVYKDAAGIWHSDRLRPLITAGANLIMNLIMVQFWGIYGILLSTVLAILLIGMPWLLHNLFSTIFDQKDLLPYLRRLGIYTIGTCLTAAVMLGVCSNISSESWFGFWGKTICCGVGANLCLLVFYFRLPEFSQGKALVLKILKRSRR